MKTHKATMNVSPLCDVCFTVLVTLMVTVPIMAISGKFKVDLPAAHTKEMRDEGALNVSIKPEGDSLLVAIGDKDAPFEEALEILAEEIKNDPGRMILIRADKFILHGMVLDLLRFAKLKGAERIAIATVGK